MIINLLIYPFLTLAQKLSNFLPGADIAMDENMFSIVFNIFRALGFILPMNAIVNILILSFSIKAAQIGWAIIIRVKSFIPTMGA